MLRKVHGDAPTQLVVASKGWDHGPVLRPPAYTTPAWLVIAARLVKLAARLVWVAARHPVATLLVGGALFLYFRYGWPADAIAVGGLAAVLAVWALVHRPSFLKAVGCRCWRGGGGCGCTGGTGNRR